MKVGIYAHCTIDTIVHGDNSYEVPGGPACYCSLIKNSMLTSTLNME